MINYFVYKNGAGNFWAPLTEEINHLYVGFDEEWSKGSEPILPATYDNGGEVPHDWRVGVPNVWCKVVPATLAPLMTTSHRYVGKATSEK